ncbi:MAG TPA: phytoene/squalene synthase family protein [Kofleriaceae bacterium]|nr:phytoene/squalene synthase family protein [Kofleriaceae bacterium]
MTDARAACRDSLATGSKSFALAARLLSPRLADHAAALYAWCRRADDAVDLVPPAEAPAAVARLRDELARCYRGERFDEPALVALQAVIRDTRLPRAYPEALLDGLAMDAAATAYATLDELYLYCYRVAGVVGLMMSHVFGVRDDRALRQAVHLGIAMQLTNVCRDVAEDWQRGRLYLPDDVLGGPALRAQLGGPRAALAAPAVARAIDRLLAIADVLYRSGDRGIPALPWRAGLAVRAARAIYARIGRELRRRGCDPLAGRAVVPAWRKALLAAAALVRQLVHAPRTLLATLRGQLPVVPRATLRFPDDVLPL